MFVTLKEKVAEVLIKSGLLDSGQLDSARAVQKKEGGKLSDILVRLGYVTEKDLMAALGESLAIPPIDLFKFKPSEDVVKIVPEQVARRYQIVPISRVGNILTVAMADPLNVFAVDDIKVMTNFEIKPVIGNEKQIAEVIEQCYQSNLGQEVQEIIAGMEEAHLEVLGIDDSEAPDSRELQRLINETPVIKIANMLLEESVRIGASDVLVEPMEKSVRVRYRVDGIFRVGKSPPKTMHNAMISRFKVMAELDIAERRLPQDGRFKAKVHGKEVDFRVAIIPTNLGEKVCLRVLDKGSVSLDLDGLGLTSKQLKKLKDVAGRPHGMILVCGPTGSGKTTTLYSLLKVIDSPEKNLVTVENPVEYQLEGINQVTIATDIGLTFASSLRSILRQDPDVIMVGEIRDYETADIAIKAALTGHLVMSTLHTTDASGSVVRLMNMGVEPFLISSSCLAIVAQRLLRAICTGCKKPYALGKKASKELVLESVPDGEPTLYRGDGCRLCSGSGYRGRTAVAEVLLVTPAIKGLIMKKASEAKIKECARKEGMMTLREHGLSLAVAGKTTLEEALRISTPDQPLNEEKAGK